MRAALPYADKVVVDGGEEVGKVDEAVKEAGIFMVKG